MRNWVAEFEDSWCGLDMTPHREKFNRRLFDTYQEELADLRNNGKLPVTEELTVEGCTVESWALDGDMELLGVWTKEKSRKLQVQVGHSVE